MPAQWQYDYQQQWTLHQPKCAHLPSQPVQDIFPSSSSIYNIYPVKIPQCKYGQEVQVKQAQRQWEWTWTATEGTEAMWEQLWFRLALGHWTPDNGAQPNSSLAQAHKATPGSDHLPSLCLYLVLCAVLYNQRRGWSLAVKQTGHCGGCFLFSKSILTKLYSTSSTNTAQHCAPECLFSPLSFVSPCYFDQSDCLIYIIPFQACATN